MTTTKPLYGTSNQTITCSLAPAGVGLANSGARASTAIDNTTNLFLDVLVQFKIKTGASGTTTTGTVNIYAYGTANGGTNYTDGASGTDGAITLTSPPNTKIIGVINCVAVASTYISDVFSVAAAFGGLLPDHWGIVIENKTGGALDTTEANHGKWYQGIQAQSV